MLISVGFPIPEWKEVRVSSVRVKGAVRRHDALDALVGIDNCAIDAELIGLVLHNQCVAAGRQFQRGILRCEARTFADPEHGLSSVPKPARMIGRLTQKNDVSIERLRQ